MNFLRLSDNDILSNKGRLIFNHDEKEEYGTAYEITEKCSLSLYIPRQVGATELEIIISSDEGELFKAFASYVDFSGELDVYSVRLPIKKLGVGLFFGKIRLKTLLGDFYAYKSYDDLRFSKDVVSAFQLTVSSFQYEAPSDKYGGIIYHVFVDRFARGGSFPKRDDMVMIDDWYAEIPEYPAYPGAYLENNTFFGGTLKGVADKLRHIKALGVNLIYLSPIFKAYSNHKYDTGDYMTVDEAFGGEEALKELILKAKKLGIGIILDGVFNHTGADSIYFNKFGKHDSLGAYQSKESEYYSWYDFKSHPNKYTSWWGIEILPRINPNVKSCESFLLKVVEKYAKMGICGIRLDVADELSDDFIAKIKYTLDKENKKSLLYGEVWEDASNKIAYDVRKKYYQGRELDGVMNYPSRKAIISYLNKKDLGEIKYLFYEVIPNAPKRIRNAEMNLLGTHDTERILTVLGGESSEGKTNDYLVNVRLNEKEREAARKKLFMAYAISATLPGIPAVFYGDEAGLEGYSDPFNRRTYPWGREDLKTLKFYKKIGNIRRKNEIYKEGSFKPIIINEDLLIFERYENKTHLITAVNNSEKTKTLRFTKNVEAMISEYSAQEIIITPYSVEIIKTDTNSFRFE